MNITEEQEADRIVGIYNIKQKKGNNLSDENYTMSSYQIITAAIQDRQSVLDELKSLFPLQDYNDEVILVSKCKSIMAQITYLKSKI